MASQLKSDDSIGSNSSVQKPPLTNSTLSVRPDNSLSGYSADREESPSSSPPVVSIHLGCQEKKRNSLQEMDACPKRRKRNELQFAASSVQADLARAGYQFSTVDPNIEHTTRLGPLSINLKEVNLVYSKEFQKQPNRCTAGVTGSLYDYQTLALACSGSYPSNVNREALSNKVLASSQDSIESASSVSESDTESVSSKTTPANESSIIIPALFSDDVDNLRAPISSELKTCNVISSKRNAVTMGESLELTTTPRYVYSVMAKYCTGRNCSNSIFFFRDF